MVVADMDMAIIYDEYEHNPQEVGGSTAPDVMHLPLGLSVLTHTSWGPSQLEAALWPRAYMRPDPACSCRRHTTAHLANKSLFA